jgi:ABC-type Fe3+-hydroxamate transport system substrate-binding protein
MIHRVDDLLRLAELEGPAERIICLVPSITETLFALGAGDRVVGITEFCVHPREHVQAKAKVGGTKNVSVEKILSLNPDLVIANVEENRKHHMDKLEKAGLKVFVTYPKTVRGCLKMIADVAALAGAEEEGLALCRSIECARAEVQASLPSVRPRVLCPIWKNPYMSINRDTFVDSVIRDAGGENVFGDKPKRYPGFTLPEVLEKKPEVILLPTEPYRFTEADKADFESLGNDLPAVRDLRIHIVEGELLSWYGPRLPRALREVSVLLRGA